MLIMNARVGALPGRAPAAGLGKKLQLGSNARRTLIAGAKKATSTPVPAEVAPAPSPTPEVPSYFLPPTPEAVQQQQQQQSYPAQPQYYQAVPQQHFAPPPPPPSGGFWSSIPPLVWVGVGVLLANVLASAFNFVKGGPQKMQEAAMQAAMNQMMKQAMKGAGPGAANPFGAPGGNPFGAGGMGGFPPMGGAGAGAAGGASPFGAGFPAGFPSSPAASQPPIDTTASPAAPPAAAASSPAAAASAAPSSAPPPKKKSAFRDVEVDAARVGASNGAAAAETPAAAASSMPPPPQMPPNFPPFGAAAAAGAAGPAGAGDPGASSMLDMLRNPEMQKMLYPYLPEPMRNPDTFEWMLNSPEYRTQLEAMLGQQMGGAGGMPGAPSAVQDLIKDADMSPEKMKAQFDALGTTPEEFVGKIMADPVLAQSMTKPSVMAAIAECTKNPMNIFKYQNDEEVMAVFEKMTTLFPQAAALGAMPGGGGMPGMPPGMPPQ